MGTPDFAVASLDKLHQSEMEVVAVVTAPDKPAGRGRKLMASAVKKYAQSHNLPVLQPTNLKDQAFCEELREYKADLFVVVAFRMLPESVWAMPPEGTINLHASLLPDYRGAAPINWAVINGESKSGATTFFINEKIDTGDILLQKEVAISENDTAGDLHDKLMEQGALLLLDTLRKVDKGNLKAIPQLMRGNYKQAPKLTKENTRINFNRPVREVYNFIRGLSPYPGAHTVLHQENTSLNCKILQAEIDGMESDGIPGSIISDKRSVILVPCADGVLKLLEIQLEGKKRMNIKDLLNGFSIAENARFD